MLPDGACREDIREQRLFYNQAMKHAASWYEYANVTCSRMAENGSLYLVTGTDKTTSWGITAFSSASRESEVLVKLTAAQIAAGSISRSHQWEINSPATVRTGSSSQQGVDHNGHAGGILTTVQGVYAAVLALVSPATFPVNQCVFARGYCISLRDGLFDMLISGQKVSANADPRTLLHRFRSSAKRTPFQKKGSQKEDDSGKPSGHVGKSVGARDGTQEEDVIVDQIPIANGVCHLTCLHFGCGLNVCETGIQSRKNRQSVAPRHGL